MTQVSRMVLIGALAVLAGCAANGGDRGSASGHMQADAKLTPAQSEAKTRLDAQMAEAERTKQSYRAMSNAALLDKLMEHGKARVEPFNSPAYRELQDRRDVDPQALTSLVTANPNADGLLPLLLLRRLDNEAYLKTPAELRARVLTEALPASKFFNEWGLPGFYLQDASSAMIESGRSALPALSHLLGDCRPAPVFGSKEYMIYLRYKFRVCDYALFFVEAIGGNSQFQMPESVEARDALIRKAIGD